MTGPDLKQALPTLAMRLGRIEFWLANLLIRAAA